MRIPGDMSKHLDVSKNTGTPKWMVKIRENPMKMDYLGVPLFLGNTHLVFWEPCICGQESAGVSRTECLSSWSGAGSNDPETVRCVTSHHQNTCFCCRRLRHSADAEKIRIRYIRQDMVAGRNADEVKKFFLEMGDVYITVEGGPGVAQDARKVMARNASVLALKRTGGSSGVGKGVTLSQADAFMGMIQIIDKDLFQVAVSSSTQVLTTVVNIVNYRQMWIHVIALVFLPSAKR